MSTLRQRFHGLLVTGRVANLPGIWTNVITGILLSNLGPGLALSGFLFHPVDLVVALLLAACLFLGGSFLREAGDAGWATRHRPERPIPLGILSPTRVAFAGYALLAAGWFGGCVFESMRWASHAPDEVLPAVRSVTVDTLRHSFYGLSYERVLLSTFLALGILLHAKFHRRLGTGGPILLALCRGLLVLWAGSLTTSWFGGNPETVTAFFKSLFPYALCIATYTLVLAMVARSEVDPRVSVPLPLLSVLTLLPPLAAILFLANQFGWSQPRWVLGLAITIFLAWSIATIVTLRHSISTFVSRALAGFCLLDALFASLIAWQAAALCLALFLLTLLLRPLSHRSPP